MIAKPNSEPITAEQMARSRDPEIRQLGVSMLAGVNYSVDYFGFDDPDQDPVPSISPPETTVEFAEQRAARPGPHRDFLPRST